MSAVGFVSLLFIIYTQGVFLERLAGASLWGLFVAAIGLAQDDEDDNVNDLGPTGMREVGK